MAACAAVVLVQLLTSGADGAPAANVAAAFLQAGGVQAALTLAAHQTDKDAVLVCLNLLHLLAAHSGLKRAADRAAAADVALSALRAHPDSEPVCKWALSILGFVCESASGDVVMAPRRAAAARAAACALARHGANASLADTAVVMLRLLSTYPADGGSDGDAAAAGAAAALLAALRAHGAAQEDTTTACMAALSAALRMERGAECGAGCVAEALRALRAHPAAAELAYACCDVLQRAVHADAALARALLAGDGRQPHPVLAAMRAQAGTALMRAAGCRTLNQALCRTGAAAHGAFGDAALGDALAIAVDALAAFPADANVNVMALDPLCTALFRDNLSMASRRAMAERGISAAALADAATGAAMRHSDHVVTQQLFGCLMSNLSSPGPSGGLPAGTSPDALRALVHALRGALRRRDGRADECLIMHALTVLDQTAVSAHQGGNVAANMRAAALEEGVPEAAVAVITAFARGQPFDGCPVAPSEAAMSVLLNFAAAPAAYPASAARVVACGVPSLIRELFAYGSHSANAHDARARIEAHAAAHAAAPCALDGCDMCAMGGRRCGHAGCFADKCPGGGALKRCSGCKAAAYCGREHQTAAWDAHKRMCKARAAADALRRELAAETNAAAAR